MFFVLCSFITIHFVSSLCLRKKGGNLGRSSQDDVTKRRQRDHESQEERGERLELQRNRQGTKRKYEEVRQDRLDADAQRKSGKCQHETEQQTEDHLVRTSERDRLTT